MSQDPEKYTRDPLVRAYAALLRSLREEQRLSRTQLAEELGYSPHWIEKVETGRKPPSEELSDVLDIFFKTPARAFHTMWMEVKRAGKHPDLPPGFSGFVDREAEATMMYIFEAMVLTGLFQTSEYARETLKTGREPDEVEQLVNKRMQRQEILTREDPPHIVAIFDEAVIRRVVGNREIMWDQIQHMIKLAQRAHITIQFVPASVGAYAGIAGAFTILCFDDRPNIAYAEGHVGGYLADEGAQVREYTIRYDLIRGAALSPDDSLALLHEVLESL